jgi:hypothetical protein
MPHDRWRRTVLSVPKKPSEPSPTVPAACKSFGEWIFVSPMNSQATVSWAEKYPNLYRLFAIDGPRSSARSFDSPTRAVWNERWVSTGGRWRAFSCDREDQS